MSSGQKITLVTPSHNQQKYLRQCLAIVSQHDVQHIVADGASEDESLATLQKHKDNNVNQFEFLSQPDQGMYQALNRGFARADGDIFGYINCDDLLLPWSTERVRTYFAENPQVDVVVADALEFYPAENRGALVVHPPTQLLNRYLRDGGFLAQPAVFFRRQVYEKLGGFDEKLKLLGDHDFWLRALQAGFRFGRLWEFLAIQRMVPGQLMQAQQQRAQQESLSIRLKLDLPLLTDMRQARSHMLYALLHRLGMARLLIARQLDGKDTFAPWPLTRAWPLTLASGLLQLEDLQSVLQHMFSSSKDKRYLRIRLDAIGLEALAEDF